MHAWKHAPVAEWSRRVPAKYMGFPRVSSNLTRCVDFEKHVDHYAILPIV